MAFDFSRTLRYSAAEGVVAAGFGGIANYLLENGLSTNVGAGAMAAHAVVANLVEQVSKKLFENFFENPAKVTESDILARLNLQYFVGQTVSAVIIAPLFSIAIEQVALLWVATKFVESVANYGRSFTPHFVEKLQVQEV